LSFIGKNEGAAPLEAITSTSHIDDILYLIEKWNSLLLSDINRELILPIRLWQTMQLVQKLSLLFQAFFHVETNIYQKIEI